jgi:hypothetical protein
MGPGDMSAFLRRAHDIDFPSTNIDIRLDSILEQFASIQKANPWWKVPKVRLMAWATSPNICLDP